LAGRLAALSALVDLGAFLITNAPKCIIYIQYIYIYIYYTRANLHPAVITDQTD
jgi:hypothetical protein